MVLRMKFTSFIGRSRVQSLSHEKNIPKNLHTETLAMMRIKMKTEASSEWGSIF